jgi:ABC-type uncharacterized transport system permease subunit
MGLGLALALQGIGIEGQMGTARTGRMHLGLEGLMGLWMVSRILLIQDLATLWMGLEMSFEEALGRALRIFWQTTLKRISYDYWVLGAWD